MGLLTQLALRVRFATIIIMVVVMAAGAYSLTRLQIELFPDIDFPLVTLITAYPQADAETVLEEVTIPLEAAVEGVDGLDTLRTRSSQDLSVVIAEFEFGTDMERAADAVAANLGSVALPPGVRPPRAVRVSVDEIPILQLSVLGPGSQRELVDLVTAEVLPAIQAIPGVFSAEVPVSAAVGSSITRTNGRLSLPLTVVKEPDISTVTVADAVMERIESLKPQLPPGVEFVTIVNQAPEIRSSIESLEREAVLGALLAVAVIFAFLISVRPTLVNGIAIPASILGALVIMNWQGMSLNMMTLGGLAISVGRVVDDSIVVLENVYRHIQQGGDRTQATLTATREVAGAIITSTLTTIAVFLPLGFIGGIIGAFFLPFALTVTYALLASLVVALTVVPVLGSIFIKPTGEPGERETWLQRAYTPIIQWALAHKLTTLLITLVLFVASLGLLRVIPLSFLPSEGEALLTVNLTLPLGSSASDTLAEAETVEAVFERLRDEGTVGAYQMTIGIGDVFGPGGQTAGAPNAAGFFVRLTRDVDGDETAELLREELAGGDRSVVVGQAGGGANGNNTLELVLTGPDYDEVAGVAERIVEALRGVAGVANVGSNADAGAPAGFEQISRVNGKRAVTISGSITDTNTQRVDRDVTQAIDALGLPPGVEVATGGVFANVREAFTQMARAMAIGVALVYLVMVISMRSLRTPFVVILSLPLASIGALGALYITQRALGLPALLGLLMLIGLVVTNAIVLIAIVEQLRAKGMSLYDALVVGGRTRLRPILMTAFTTSFALLPLAVIVSEGGIISAELATVVIGGLATSTFLTLVVIPVVYSMVHRRSAARQAVTVPAGETLPATDD